MTKSSASHEIASKDPTLLGLDNCRGKWRYRFKVNGRSYSEVTDLEAVPANILEAQRLKVAHREQVLKGRNVVRQIRVSVDHAISEFNAWYKANIRAAVSANGPLR